ncbi:autolytic lysozyme [Lachnospiraceae bacterium]|nr:autolytic lysozyme [Lachnospiraceae bacterium]
MRLPGDNEERNASLSMKYMLMGVSLSVLLILGVVVFTNKQEEARRQRLRQQEQEKETTVLALEHEDGTGEQAGTGENPGEGGEDAQEAVTEQVPVVGFAGRKSMQEVERLYQENKLTASDLDFWDMYPEKEELAAGIGAGDAAGAGNTGNTGNAGIAAGEEKDKAARYDEEAKALAEEEEKKAAEEDPSKDGKHTLLTYADGTEEWVLINPYLEQNTYDYTKMQMRADKMAYYEDGRSISYLGADLSKYNGDVDFHALKESGIEFVMLRLGARGYGSGQILLDEKFEEYMNKASEAGLDIGVYFFSQAITAEEAVEESNFIIQTLTERNITYPVAFDMEYVQNDKARVEILSKEEKTAVARAFLENIKAAGYKPMIYGTKEWLIKEINLTKLTDYDIWLSQQKDIPDYPYKFQMWQYTTEGDIPGVEGDVDLNICFVDYGEK